MKNEKLNALSMKINIVMCTNNFSFLIIHFSFP